MLGAERSRVTSAAVVDALVMLAPIGQGLKECAEGLEHLRYKCILACAWESPC